MDNNSLNFIAIPASDSHHNIGNILRFTQFSIQQLWKYQQSPKSYLKCIDSWLDIDVFEYCDLGFG